ncbi:MAG: hypothetical protein CMB64_01600 [Euryarchaeota archaeon]|nr:hypothetical protein [Euryarchaeota archaeon]
MNYNDLYYAIESPGKNANFLVKSKNKEGILRCCELMNELEPGELGVPKFIVVTMHDKKPTLSEAVSNGTEGEYE